MNRIPTESEDQIAFVHWFKIVFPKVRILAIPNGIRASIGAAIKAKREGVSAGVPDLFIPEWKMFIEMKRLKGGVVSPEQKEWIAYLSSIGYKVHICRGFDEAVMAVKEFV